MKNVQLIESSKINVSLLTVIIELAIDRGRFVELYDIKKSELEDIFLRPFYLEDDKLFFFNIMSAIYLKDEDINENDNIILDFETDFYDIHENVNFFETESINHERLKMMLSKAERENVSVFSVFYEWFRSTLYYKNGESYNSEDNLKETFDKIMLDYID